jgi:hypothetical protein
MMLCRHRSLDWLAGSPTMANRSPAPVTYCMANLDFYALCNDLRKLFEFLYSETDVVAYELSSEFGRDPRRFESLEELAAAFNLGTYRAGHLQLWSPSVMTRPIIRRVELKVPDHSFRYEVGGIGLIQLYLDGVRDDVIYHTHFGHWNEAGAKQRSMYSANDCDWHALAKLSSKVQGHIRGTLAAAKLYARPVLHQAFAAVQEGHGLWFGPAIHHAGSRDIRTRPPKCVGA